MEQFNLTVIEPILRTVIIFLIVLAIARILGRKQISQLTFFDYVAGTAIGSLSASAMSNSAIPLLTDLVCFLTWTSLIIIVNVLTLRSAPARKLLDDQPRVVIRDGKILEKNLGNSSYTVSDLLMQLREKEVFDPKEIDIGILEVNGDLSILKKPEYQTITAKDLNISSKNVSSKYNGKELIINGEMLPLNLRELGTTEEWLKHQLETHGISDMKNVALAILTPNGKLYLDMEIDSLQERENSIV